MKQFNITKTALIFGMLLVSYSCKTSQETISQINNIVEADRYTFIAQTATPMGRGKLINLSSQYTLKVSSDSIEAYLPYFGVAYTAPSPMDEGGIKFTSTKFEYHKPAKEKGSWNINIKTQDTKQNYRLHLNISESGYSTLQVHQNDKQPISFYGRIE